MGLNCGASCAKYILFAFNLIFFLGGGAVLGIGIWILVNAASFQSVVDQISPDSATVMQNSILATSSTTVHTVGGILVGVGAFVFLVGFMGCCGACKEWRPLLVGYAICLIIIMLVEVGVGIAVGVYKDKVKDAVTTELVKIADLYDYVPTHLVSGSNSQFAVNKTTGGNPDIVQATAAFNALQSWIGCCGVTKGYLDFSNSPYSRNPFGNIPPVFCCKFYDAASLRLASDGKCYAIHERTNLEVSNFNTGCVNRIENFVNDNAPIIIGVAVGIGLIELVGVFFAFCLCCAIGDKHRYD
ncbi:tetraspanin-8-like [Paramacrobiotus metropolitanus]|uniref:tetraspanin-8-like n=1 Tax=Paramacrobiotus metropolitanus TaxID=2943436 RepID=UPI002445DBE7|nr:tetraspanin-8-like [Paramacrobiotus metropolitanus]XP_055341863.1 tetraspanin-8-like [Paramacrobiotus metropolitanus]XP_055341872.1 tetraspanin-8-like [Paramacrobiotus metropolitanus]XP_055341881.1 tetraspanin-8-like [Paramacrobiotus metropolitanus]